MVQKDSVSGPPLLREEEEKERKRSSNPDFFFMAAFFSLSSQRTRFLNVESDPSYSLLMGMGQGGVGKTKGISLSFIFYVHKALLLLM